MAPEERQSKVLTAWVRATDDIAVAYGDDGPHLRRGASCSARPGLATRGCGETSRREKRGMGGRWPGRCTGGDQCVAGLVDRSDRDGARWSGGVSAYYNEIDKVLAVFTNRAPARRPTLQVPEECLPERSLCAPVATEFVRAAMEVGHAS
jgi:hypothetical protein